mmetsp:Transcript_30069/g.45950  ORF Transcript_30069/g.45950 Transcript_30069/m.45950 type:complete len:98 (+) Transcript_30069:531-824(+)
MPSVPFRTNQQSFDPDLPYKTVAIRRMTKDQAKEVFNKFSWNLESLIDHLYVKKPSQQAGDASLSIEKSQSSSPRKRLAQIYIADPKQVKRVILKQY